MGITLAFIEIKSPKSAIQIQTWINDFEVHINDLGHRITRSKRSQEVITVFVILLFLAVIPALWGLFVLPTAVWIFFFFVAAIIVFIIGLHLLVQFIRSLNTFSNGKAIGSLGVCLTSLGIMGELYQIINIWLG